MAVLLAGSPAAAAPLELDPSRVGWSALVYHAKKLTFSLSSRVAFEVAAAGSVGEELRETKRAQPVMPRRQVAVVTLEAQGLGADTTTRLWVDPLSGVALQRRQISRGRRTRNKTLRFTDAGVHVFFGRPAPGEAEAEPETWTDATDRFDDYPDWASGGLKVTEPTVIFYLLAGAPLDRVGDVVHYPVWSNEKLLLMEMRVAALVQLKVDYVQEGERRRGRIPALKILIDARHLDSDARRQDLEILGLQGAIEVYLDLETRAPLEISGKVPLAGNTKVRLQSLTPR